MQAGKYRDRIKIEAPTMGQGDYGEPVATWSVLAASLPAQVQDELPSKSEAVQQGLVINKSRARIRFRYLATVTSACRITFGARVFAIIGGPAVLGNREDMEVLGETASS